MLDWLLAAGIGPAAVAVPVNWTAAVLAGAARGWFRRLSRTDDLSRLVKAGTGTSVDLSNEEFTAVRQLLEDQQTWDIAGCGTVADLASQIASCLPPRDGRTAADSYAAALTIARGLLEFAVADLEPKQFQQLLLTRLQRLQTDQASALDRALLDLHADLAAGFSGVMSDLKRALDRLPPGPAGRAEIVVYLTTLIDWMTVDPWPTDQRFGGSALTPAAIERRLRISVPDRRDNRYPDADDLAQRCQKLVILGGPGSGKTWLAKRTVRRCAQEALDALGAGESVDEVELPLYTTCSRLSTADGDIRQAAVSSAITQLGDLGGSRLTAAVHVFFTERNAPTVLVIDALDEAHGSSERLLQAGTLPWRIVLTSRPSSWNRQLVLEEGNQAQLVGELQPLRYPADVVPFIRQWFSQQPKLGNDLAEQIALRPDLQRAATVPLILAMYCIIGGRQPLPESWHDLHGKVLRRMLTGRWRSGDTRRPDVETCLRTLRAWAWDGAAAHPVSGVGLWADEISTEPGQLAQADEDALDHLAPPTGLPDVDTGRVQRRFIHRSIREHLVAQHVARLPVDEAAAALLPHLWYDPDWEFAAPAALAMHPERGQLVRDLIRRAARSDDIPGDLSVIDGGWQLRGLLARVAAESSDTDWSPEIAGMIGQVRLELALSGYVGWIPSAAGWGNSNRQAREVLTKLLDGQVSGSAAAVITSGVVKLAVTAQDKRESLRALLGLIPRVTDTYVVEKLLDGVVELAATEDDRHEAWQALIGLLSQQTDRLTAADLASKMAKLASTESDKRQARQVLMTLLCTPLSASTYNALMSRLAELTTTEAAKHEVGQVLLGLLALETEVRAIPQLLSVAAELTVTDAQKGQARAASLKLLAQETRSHALSDWLNPMLKLGLTAQDKLRVREVLLSLMPHEVRGTDALAVVRWLVKLDPTTDDQRQARTALLGLLTYGCDSRDAAAIVDGLTQLAPTEADRRKALDLLTKLYVLEETQYPLDDAALLSAISELLTRDEDRAKARAALLNLLTIETNVWTIPQLVSALVKLAAKPEDKIETRQALLRLASTRANSWLARDYLRGILSLATAEEDRRETRQALLAALAAETDGSVAAALIDDGLARLDPMDKDEDQARDALVKLVSQPAASRKTDAVASLVRLAGTAEVPPQARAALLSSLAEPTDGEAALDLVDGLYRLTPTLQDAREVRAALLVLLARETAVPVAIRLVHEVVRFGSTSEDCRQARTALFALLTGETDSYLIRQIVGEVIRLNPTTNDLLQARTALLALLTPQTPARDAEHMATLLTQLDPTVDDLDTWLSRDAQPTFDLLGNARWNSPLPAWLSALPSLARLSANP